MTAVHRHWTAILVVAAALACGVADGPTASLEHVDPAAADSESLLIVEPPVPPPEVVAPAVAPRRVSLPSVSEAKAVTPPPKIASTPESTLADLLRLPDSDESGDLTGARREAGQESVIPGDGSAKDPLLRLQFRTRTDPTAGHQKARTQTDAGVSVGVGGETRVRGGVRVEQEMNRDREEPVPTVGIEKRF